MSKGGFGGKGMMGGKGKGWGGNSWGGGWSSPMQSWGKSFGKGFGKDKGKGKGKFTSPPSKKVWIGGLPESESIDKELNKALQEHMKQAGNCKHVMIGKTGQGAASFSTEEEVQ